MSTSSHTDCLATFPLSLHSALLLIDSRDLKPKLGRKASLCNSVGGERARPVKVQTHTGRTTHKHRTVPQETAEEEAIVWLSVSRGVLWPQET